MVKGLPGPGIIIAEPALAKARLIGQQFWQLFRRVREILGSFHLSAAQARSIRRSLRSSKSRTAFPRFRPRLKLIRATH